ncbi:hypothetical protein AB0D04_22690 [Streptomyces sp. NPDC048483]|uniref:hypothetical protein n=1 Tax=Streptomyces sp. NPDC048483 TaxID=3154927 RepID=UPI003419C8DE
MPQPNQPESERPVPTNAEEALAIGRARFEALCDDGTPAPLYVQEFDIGYLIYAVFPPPAAPDDLPSFGGSHLVISKADGALSYVPNYPPESAIELYRERHQPHP